MPATESGASHAADAPPPFRAGNASPQGRQWRVPTAAERSPGQEASAKLRPRFARARLGRWRRGEKRITAPPSPARTGGTEVRATVAALDAPFGETGGAPVRCHTRTAGRKRFTKSASEKIGAAHPYLEKGAVNTSGYDRRTSRWCGREDSNFHGLPHSDLNAARLPIPPRPHVTKGPDRAGPAHVANRSCPHKGAERDLRTIAAPARTASGEGTMPVRTDTGRDAPSARPDANGSTLPMRADAERVAAPTRLRASDAVPKRAAPYAHHLHRWRRPSSGYRHLLPLRGRPKDG